MGSVSKVLPEGVLGRALSLVNGDVKRSARCCLQMHQDGLPEWRNVAWRPGWWQVGIRLKCCKISLKCIFTFAMGVGGSFSFRCRIYRFLVLARSFSEHDELEMARTLVPY